MTIDKEHLISVATQIYCKNLELIIKYKGQISDKKTNKREVMFEAINDATLLIETVNQQCASHNSEIKKNVFEENKQ